MKWRLKYRAPRVSPRNLCCSLSIISGLIYPKLPNLWRKCSMPKPNRFCWDGYYLGTPWSAVAKIPSQWDACPALFAREGGQTPWKRKKEWSAGGGVRMATVLPIINDPEDSPPLPPSLLLSNDNGFRPIISWVFPKNGTLLCAWCNFLYAVWYRQRWMHTNVIRHKLFLKNKYWSKCSKLYSTKT